MTAYLAGALLGAVAASFWWRQYYLRKELELVLIHTRKIEELISGYKAVTR